MDPKEYLQQYQLFNVVQLSYTATIQLAQRDLDGLDLNTWEIERRKLSKALAEQLKEIITDCEHRRRDYTFRCQEIRSTINRLTDPEEHRIITMRYIDLMRWEDIADQLYVSVCWVHCLHNKALETIGQYVS